MELLLPNQKPLDEYLGKTNSDAEDSGESNQNTAPLIFLLITCHGFFGKWTIAKPVKS